MALRITGDTMSLEIDNRLVASARFSRYAAADGNGAWIVSTHPARPFTHDQAIAVLTVAGLGERVSDSHPLMVALPWSCGDRPAH